MTAGSPRLQLAHRIAAAEIELPGLNDARAVCILARQELEVIVAELLAARGLHGSGSTMRTKLICLRHAYGPASEVSVGAADAWSRLSTACHHHAYELGPTLGEAFDLLELVVSLRPSSADDTPA